MFGWFRPTCPCDPEAKRWVEQRLRWLTRHFGLHVLLEAPVVLPTEEFFPDRWDASREAVRLLFDRVCGYMGVEPNAVRLKLFTDKPLHGATGFAVAQWQDGEESWELTRWRRHKVGVKRRGASDPALLVAEGPYVPGGGGAPSHQRVMPHEQFLSRELETGGAMVSSTLAGLHVGGYPGSWSMRAGGGLLGEDDVDDRGRDPLDERGRDPLSPHEQTSERRVVQGERLCAESNRRLSRSAP